MNMENMFDIIAEMTEEAAKEIGYEYDYGCALAVSNALLHDYGISEVDLSKPMTYQKMTAITKAIQQWQTDAKNNYLTH